MTERERALLQGKKINPLTANESALAYAVAHSGGSEPTYETVAEIQVGEMVLSDGFYAYASNLPYLSVDETKNYYLNDENHPNDGFAPLGNAPAICWGCEYDDGNFVPIDPSVSWVAVADDDGVIGIISDTPDLSNTTVRILKKVEQGGGDLPENLKPTYVVHLKIGENKTATVDEDIDDILAAIANGQNVKAVYSMGGTNYELQFSNSFSNAGSSDATITFYMMVRNSTTTLRIMELNVERINGVQKATVQTITAAITLDA